MPDMKEPDPLSKDRRMLVPTSDALMSAQNAYDKATKCFLQTRIKTVVSSADPQREPRLKLSSIELDRIRACMEDESGRLTTESDCIRKLERMLGDASALNQTYHLFIHAQSSEEGDWCVRIN